MVTLTSYVIKVFESDERSSIKPSNQGKLHKWRPTQIWSMNKYINPIKSSLQCHMKVIHSILHEKVAK